jgi:hypothetical protein
MKTVFYLCNGARSTRHQMTIQDFTYLSIGNSIQIGIKVYRIFDVKRCLTSNRIFIFANLVRLDIGATHRANKTINNN